MNHYKLTAFSGIDQFPLKFRIEEMRRFEMLIIETLKCMFHT